MRLLSDLRSRLSCIPTIILPVIVAALLASSAMIALSATAGAQGQLPAGMGGPSPEYDPAKVTIPATPPTALAGAAIYQQNCAPCHGEQGLGDGPTASQLGAKPTAFADAATMTGISPAQMFFITKYGRMQNMMPPWSQRLDDTQIWNAVAYAWSLHTKQTAVDAGKELYNASCASCHGPTGQGDGPKAQGKLSSFADPKYAMFKSSADWQKGWQTAHPEQGQDWSPTDRENVLQYIRTFSYLPPWESPYKPGTGVISGTVVQGTAGGPAVAGLPVVLEAFVGFDKVASFTSTVSANSTFSFTNLAIDPSISYLASVGFDGISYSSDLATLSPVTPTLQSKISVFQTTEDPAGLRINRSHWIIDHQPGALMVGEIYTFGNNGDRTFVGRNVSGLQERGTVELHLPAGATEITFDNGELGNRFQQVGDVVYDTLPVIPGSDTRQIIVRYAVPYKGTSLDIKQTYPYPIDQLTLLVADLPQLKVEAPQLDSAGKQDIQGQSFQLWSKAGMAAGPVEVKMQNLLETGSVDPRAAAGANAGSTASGAGGSGEATGAMPEIAPPLEPWVSWAMFGIVGAGALALLGVALRRHGGSLAPQEQDRAQLRNSLLDQIAKVDDQHALGVLSDADWAARRASLKAQLMDLTLREEQAVG